MASNALTMFDPKANMPAHVASFFGDEGSNIADRQTVPSLSPQGKQWTISLDGNKTVLQRRNADGDVEPVSTLRVVVLDYAKRRGRAYYEGAYDPAKESAPICWSDDGIAPDDSLPTMAAGVTPEPGQPRKMASRCDACPMAAKGSKITDNGKAVTACSQHRMLAVVPAMKLDMEPLRLKIAITSDFDKQSPDAEAQGWYAFSNYTDFLKSRGVQHTAAIVTKMKFDHNAAYPKIFFAADRWLEPAELAQVAPLTKDERVQKLLGGTWTPAGPDGVQKEGAAPNPAPAAQSAGNAAAGAAAATTEVPSAAAPAAQPAADDDDDGAMLIMGLDAPAAQPSQGAAQAGQAVAAEPAAQTTTAAPAATAQVDPALATLLADWGD